MDCFEEEAGLQQNLVKKVRDQHDTLMKAYYCDKDKLTGTRFQVLY